MLDRNNATRLSLWLTIEARESHRYRANEKKPTRDLHLDQDRADKRIEAVIKNIL
jgi:hypothetical protein